jgi:hypothetical protein
MPSTYTLISSNVLSSSAASVTFSAIPSTYTDLVLWASHRNDMGVRVNDQLTIRFEASGANTNHSRTQVSGNGASAASSRVSSDYAIQIDEGTVGPGATSNTFATSQFYIPSYTSSANKPVGIDNATETNGTTAWRIGSAGLWRNTSAVSTIIIATNGNFVSGSSFYLYGIKNS